MLVPRRTKYNKCFKGRMKGASKRGNNLIFGKHGMQAITTARVTSAQIEATRRVLIYKLRKIGKIWIRIFPDVPVTQKPAEVRQGGGKGAVDRWVFKVRPGRVLFEIDGVSRDEALSIFRVAASKLPIKIKTISSVSEEVLSEVIVD